MSLFEIVLEKNMNEGVSDFWIEIIKQLISGIAIGFSLALIGYFIWKKQNLYSKKFDVYIGLISSLTEIYRLATNSILYDKISFVDKPNLKTHFINNKEFICELQKNKLLFIIFFGNEYRDKIEYFIDIEKNIENVEIEFKEGSIVFTKNLRKKNKLQK